MYAIRNCNSIPLYYYEPVGFNSSGTNLISTLYCGIVMCTRQYTVIIGLCGIILRYIATAILLKCENVCDIDIADPNIAR